MTFGSQDDASAWLSARRAEIEMQVHVADNGDPIFWARHLERERIQRWTIAEH
jgi:hypothetical protein